MKYSNKITLTVAALATAFAFSATAAEDEKPERDGKRGERKRPTPEQMLTRLDKDGDKHLSLAEFKASKAAQGNRAAGAEKRFKAMDGNSDGKVSKDEMVAAFKKMAERRGKAGDRPKRGSKKGDKRGAKDAG
ncbi:MAG: hypothetical protein P8J87_15165 [Verrucomicrobiales bacterium]|nr:hypothetical protein [Verrucomicrobiales bacterium]